MESASSLRFEIADYLPRKFLFSIIIAFSMLTVALLCGAWLGNQIPGTEAEEIAASMEEEIAQLTSQTVFMRSLSIFINNSGLSLLSFVPFVGWGWILLITYNTGFFLGTFAQMLGGDPVIRLLLTLFVVFVFPGLPVALLEFGAYILLFGESLYVSYLALTRSGAKQRLRRHSWKTLLIYVVMLFVGAFIEAAMMGL
jgi:uncharacterized membrane protein SpoIIM required for sporulation